MPPAHPKLSPSSRSGAQPFFKERERAMSVTDLGLGDQNDKYVDYMNAKGYMPIIVPRGDVVPPTVSLPPRNVSHSELL